MYVFLCTFQAVKFKPLKQRSDRKDVEKQLIEDLCVSIIQEELKYIAIILIRFKLIWAKTADNLYDDLVEKVIRENPVEPESNPQELTKNRCRGFAQEVVCSVALQMHKIVDSSLDIVFAILSCDDFYQDSAFVVDHWKAKFKEWAEMEYKAVKYNNRFLKIAKKLQEEQEKSQSMIDVD